MIFAADIYDNIVNSVQKENRQNIKCNEDNKQQR